MDNGKYLVTSFMSHMVVERLRENERVFTSSAACAKCYSSQLSDQSSGWHHFMALFAKKASRPLQCSLGLLLDNPGQCQGPRCLSQLMGVIQMIVYKIKMKKDDIDIK